MQTETVRRAPWPSHRAGVPRIRIAAVPRELVWLGAILATSLGLRLAWVLFTNWHPVFDDDAFRYDFAARALAEGRGYIHLSGEPTAFWPPGYPLLLSAVYALFGESVRAAQLLNVALGTATVALVYLIGKRTLGAQAAIVGAAITAMFPSLIFFTGVTLSEITFTFLVLLAILLVLIEAQRDASSGSRQRLALLFATGLVLGCAALVRGQALLLPLVLVPFWLRSGVSWTSVGTKVGVLAIGIAAIVLPWTVRNAIQLDSPVLVSTNAGVDFWIGHNEAAGRPDQAAGAPLVLRHPELDGVQRELRANRDGFREGLAFAATHPARELVLPFKKLFWLYYNDEEGLRWNEGHGSQPFLSEPVRAGLLGFSNVYYFAIIGLVLLGIPLWFTLRDPGRLLLVSLVAYWTLVHLVFFGDPRFHAPVLPMVALLAALPWAALWSGRMPWERPREPGLH